MAALDQITIKGFKSIRELTDLKLGNLNVLIGANGAGKSNFVDFFRMLRAMADDGLTDFVKINGGADGFLFNGPSETRRITAHLKFGKAEYRIVLEPTVAGEMIVKDEAIGKLSLEGIIGKPLIIRAFKSVPGTVYHFHDTSRTAPVRRDGSARDFRELRSDAGNVAAFLLKMRADHGARYQRIRETVQVVAPFFDDFLLEPQMKGDNELVRLEWRQKGSTFPFQPWHLSDGTIRFISLTTALLQSNPPSTIVIDEPELGLHPFALEVLAQLLKESAERAQLVISTQSETLLSQFQPEDVIVVDRAEGTSRFRRLEPEPFAEWLKDYSLGELLQKNIIEAGPANA